MKKKPISIIRNGLFFIFQKQIIRNDEIEIININFSPTQPSASTYRVGSEKNNYSFLFI